MGGQYANQTVSDILQGLTQWKGSYLHHGISTVGGVNEFHKTI